MGDPNVYLVTYDHVIQDRINAIRQIKDYFIKKHIANEENDKQMVPGKNKHKLFFKRKPEWLKYTEDDSLIFTKLNFDDEQSMYPEKNGTTYNNTIIRCIGCKDDITDQCKYKMFAFYSKKIIAKCDKCGQVIDPTTIGRMYHVIMHVWMPDIPSEIDDMDTISIEEQVLNDLSKILETNLWSNYDYY